MELLFEKGKIGTLILRNRIIMTAVHTGFSFEEETRFLERRARGGAAAVTAVMGVSKTGTPSNMSVLEPEIREQLSEMAKAVHRESGKLLIQLFHAGRNGAPELADSAVYPVAPSPIASTMYETTLRELTIDEIQQAVEQFGQAANICRSAGVDGVEISCSAGYLLSQFLSSLTNKREDDYGGNDEKRMRFPLEVIREVRASVGNFYPVILRVSGSDMLGGYGISDTVRFIREAEQYLDAVNVTGGWHESPIPQITMQVPEGVVAFFAREVKQNIKIPVIACNRINNEQTAGGIIAQGYADFVGCARAFLADSDFVSKMQNGISYRRCIGCSKGCIEKVLRQQKVSCVFNPEVGREGEVPPRKEAARKILVIGGGVAGIEAALQCAKKGDDVRLCTDENKIGGLLHAAAKAPYKETIIMNIKAMRGELERRHVQVICSTFVDSSYVNMYNPDFIVVATGSKPVVLPIPGADRRHVYTAQRVLEGGETFAVSLLKGKIFIVGGGAVGLETALFLAKKLRFTETAKRFFSDYAEKGIRANIACSSGITIVEMGGEMGLALGGLRRFMLKELRSRGVELITNATVEEIAENGVVLNVSGQTIFREADTTIMATGYRPQGQSLINWLEDSGKYPYRVIGSANRTEGIGSALKEAYEICR